MWLYDRIIRYMLPHSGSMYVYRIHTIFSIFRAPKIVSISAIFTSYLKHYFFCSINIGELLYILTWFHTKCRTVPPQNEARNHEKCKASLLFPTQQENQEIINFLRSFFRKEWVLMPQNTSTSDGILWRGSGSWEVYLHIDPQNITYSIIAINQVLTLQCLVKPLQNNNQSWARANIVYLRANVNAPNSYCICAYCNEKLLTNVELTSNFFCSLLQCAIVRN